MQPERALLDVRLEVDADALHVARQLLRRLLEGEVEAALATPRRLLCKVRRQAGLAGAGGTAHQNRGAAVVALAVEHIVERWDAARQALVADRVVEPHATQWQDRESFLVDDEGV